jgi:hypothetical protein
MNISKDSKKIIELSQHIIHIRFPLEGQFVHYAKKYANLAEALNYRDGVTILSTLYNVRSK